MHKNEVLLPGEFKLTHQLCNACGSELPLDDAYWHRDARNESGFRTDACKECRNKAKEDAEKEEIDRRYRQLLQQGFLSLDQLSKHTTDIPHVGEVYQRIMEVMGGAPGFAKHVGLHIMYAQPGTSIKQKALEMMMRLANNVSESGAANKSFEALTDEELDEELRRSAQDLLPMQTILEESDTRAG